MSQAIINICDLCHREERQDPARFDNDWMGHSFGAPIVDYGDCYILMCPTCQRAYSELIQEHNGQVRAFLGKFGFKVRG